MREDLTERGVEGEQGFMLVGLIVAIFLILLALSVAAPKVAQGLRREREVEAVRRGNQYVRAIRLYYKKTGGHYPGSIEQLEKTNNIRFLRQRYIDPITGKDDWRLIKVGEAKTTVKGFFGQPLAGLTPGLGSAAGMGSAGGIGAGAAGPGQPGSGSAFGGSSLGAGSGVGGGLGSSSPGSSGMPTLGGSSPGGTSSGPATLGGDSSSTGSSAGSTNTLGSASGNASQLGGGTSGGGAPFVGVGVPKEGDSITVLNEQTTYNTWEFIYDPRIEQLYAKASLFGGASSGTPGLGSAAGNSSGIGGSPTTPGTGTAPGTTSPTTPPQPPQQ